MNMADISEKFIPCPLRSSLCPHVSVIELPAGTLISFEKSKWIKLGESIPSIICRTYGRLTQ